MGGQISKKGCKQCDKGTFNDLAGQPSCRPCPANFYSKAAGYSVCLPCEVGYTSDPGSSECKHGKVISNIIKTLEQQKEKVNDVAYTSQRLWQTEETRLLYDALMDKRKAVDNQEEKKVCEKEREDGTVIFPAMEIQIETEKIEDTTCISKNRDELLNSFCSFTSRLDELFKNVRIEKEAKTFWPNICCKERNDTRLEACKDPSGKIKREKIIPFALSQGGKFSRHNLYSEVKEAIKYGGYIHEGMKQLIDSLPLPASLNNLKHNETKRVVEEFFRDVSLCGPRIVDAPGAKEETKLCQLFIPYQHTMERFYDLIQSVFLTEMTPQSSFLETMERSLRDRSQAA